ncbi:alpha-2-macroglobulin family protein [uncultured Duncaniella sp.]|uniref:alpha-2-macroglobulin family protein n=3 Tax=uncultured Duncaniella sp. TaxID=2768039 RepID=UPI00272FA3B7|nr:alpha-2-macroglobulin family protein [uncultured Duncaniella sp.]
MRIGKIFILLFTFISVSIHIDMNANTPKTPDFAYPKTVSTESLRQLSAALKTDDGSKVVRALMDYYLARTAIDSGNAGNALAKIDSIATASSDDILKSMLFTLEADIYSALYMNQRWKYDSRETPATPLPDDFNEWNGIQFRSRISALLDKALNFTPALKTVPIGKYSSVIDLSAGGGNSVSSITVVRTTEIYYPTLYDFVANRAISLLSSNGIINSVLSWGLLTRHDLYTALPFSKYDPNVGRILELYASLLKFHAPGSAPFINTDLQRLTFISERVYQDNSMSVSDRKSRLLRELYDENSSSEYSGDILLAFPDSYNDPRWLYASIGHNIKTYPAYPLKNNLINKRTRIAEQEIYVTAPSVVAPETETELKLRISNVVSGKVYIYNVSSSLLTDNSYAVAGLPKFKPVAVLPFKSAETEVPFKENINLKYKFPSAGNYIAIPTIDGKPVTGKKWYDKIHVTAYAIASSRFESASLWALDAKTGAPVEGAEFTLYPNNRRGDSSPKTIGKTNAEGSAACSSNGYVTLTKGTDRYANPLWIYSDDNKFEEKWYKSASGYSSLPLYHPGDSVEWMAIVYEYQRKNHRPVIGKEVTAILRNASYMAIDTLKLTTDPFGRINGNFILPKEGLTGTFHISLENYGDAVRFTVSDYKLPTFRVILDPVECDYPSAGAATLRGHIETYAGFPVANAGLTVDISALQRTRWWWNRPAEVKFSTLEATSDEKGDIEITLPKDLLEISPIPGGIFSVTISALSPSGETQTASTIFTMGSRYVIRPSVPENIDITSPTAAIRLQTVNYQDSTIAMPVNYEVIRDSATILRGTIRPADATIDLTSLASGPCELRFSLADSAMAEPVSQNVVLYRPTDTATPVPGRLLWYPTDKVSIKGSTAASWLYAVDCPTNLLVSIHTDSKLISRRWVKAGEGMHTLPIELPAGVDEASVEISLTGNYRNSSARLTAKRDMPAKGIKFISESFRDRLVPGSEETWTFRVVDRSDNGKEAAVVLDMYNTALDALVRSSWEFTPMTQGPRYHYFWEQSDLSAESGIRISAYPDKFLSEYSVLQPTFDTYRRTFSNTKIYLSGTRSYKAAATTLNAVAEHKEEVVVEEAMSSADGAVTFNSAGMASADMASAEAAYETDMGAAEGENGVSEEKPESSKPFSFRENEVSLAFFKPMLTTDANGRLSFTFTVPNANTRWGFRALAYTDSLLSTNFSADVMANKPVMVQPNLPRFLRSGDSATIIASVMNSSDKQQKITTKVELFNPADGKVIAEYTQVDEIAPSSAATVSTGLVAPADAPFIGYRIKSSTDMFADGEQSLIPILPAVSPVIDTYPFYIAPDDKDFSMPLPKVPADARVTLEFCDNPTWYVVTALPGLLEQKASTANEAAASIFSASIASGLLRDHPVIATAIREWTESDRDGSALTSMLERNDDLKQILLAATPWMLDAKNDTERMNRLALLFDSKTLESTLNANIATLRKLVRNNGGWAWFGMSDEASMWATQNVLLLFGELHRLGFMPERKELSSMTANALSWFDKKNGEAFAKSPKGDYTLYVYLRDLYRNVKGMSAPRRNIVNATVQRILEKWKTAGVFEKGIYARILFDNSYPSVAKTILESLRQYSEYTPEKGMWWPSLDDMTLWSMGKVGTTAMLLSTFATVDPDCQDIDRIRQWLILQKQATDWGTSVSASSAIAVILSTSTKWIEPADAKTASQISIDGHIVKPDRYELMTGYFRTPLSLSPEKAGELKVKHTGDTPSWGAVFCLYTDSMTSVKAHSCQDLSIGKSIAAGGNHNDGTLLKVGDRISVTLTVKADRDMDYVTIVDERPGCYEPVEQLPAPIYAEGIRFYRENRDSSTRFFITHLPKGTYVLTYDMWVNNAGSFASGVATIQSLYSPSLSAHTAGTTITVTQ